MVNSTLITTLEDSNYEGIHLPGGDALVELHNTSIKDTNIMINQHMYDSGGLLSSHYWLTGPELSVDTIKLFYFEDP